MTAYIKSKKFYQTSQSQGLALLSLLLVFSIFCLFFVYLVQTNSIVDKSYQIREQKERLKELQAENQRLEMAVAQWRSPANLEELVQGLGMVETEEVVYLKEKAVAFKE